MKWDIVVGMGNWVVRLFSRNGIFGECYKTGSWDTNKFKVKSVLKTVVPNLGQGNRVPIKSGGGRGQDQKDAGKNGNKIYNEDFKLTKVINEKCEEDYGWWDFEGWSDLDF